MESNRLPFAPRAAVDRRLDDFPILEDYMPELQVAGNTVPEAIAADQFGPLPEMSER